MLLKLRVIIREDAQHGDHTSSKEAVDVYKAEN